MIADVTGCAVELVHHVRKTGGNEVTVEDGRGAVALLAAARSARVLNRMSSAEAAKAGVEKAGTYFRVDHGKLNLAPPPDRTQWHQLVSVDLENGTDVPLDVEDAREDPTLSGSDYVGVVATWEWPDPLKDVSVADLRPLRPRLGRAAGGRTHRRGTGLAGLSLRPSGSMSRTPPTKLNQGPAQDMDREWNVCGHDRQRPERATKGPTSRLGNAPMTDLPPPKVRWGWVWTSHNLLHTPTPIRGWGCGGEGNRYFVSRHSAGCGAHFQRRATCRSAPLFVRLVQSPKQTRVQRLRNARRRHCAHAEVVSALRPWQSPRAVRSFPESGHHTRQMVGHDSDIRSHSPKDERYSRPCFRNEARRLSLITPSEARLAQAVHLIGWRRSKSALRFGRKADRKGRRSILKRRSGSPYDLAPPR
jgi:hypothetical protein